MQAKVQFLAILTSLALLLVVLRLVYRRQLREGYSLLWLLAAIILLGLSIFGGVLTRVADFFDVTYPPSLLFAVAQLFSMIILLSQSIIITGLARKNRDQAQKLAILEWRIEQLRAEVKKKAGGDNEPLEKSDRSDRVLIASQELEIPQ